MLQNKSTHCLGKPASSISKNIGNIQKEVLVRPIIHCTQFYVIQLVRAILQGLGARYAKQRATLFLGVLINSLYLLHFCLRYDDQRSSVKLFDLMFIVRFEVSAMVMDPLSMEIDVIFQKGSSNKYKLQE